MFFALLKSSRPQLKVDLVKLQSEAADRSKWPALCNQAFDLAFQEFQIPKLLDGEDIAAVSVTKPDEKSILAYVSLLIGAIRRNRIDFENCIPTLYFCL